MTSDSTVFNVLSNYTALPRSVQAKRMGGAGGFSGSQIWQITTAERKYCLRQWPEEHPDRSRLSFIHTVLRRAASEGLTFVPDPLQTSSGASFIEHGSRLWELTPWLPGIADYWTHPTTGRLAAAMIALARFHQATRACATPAAPFDVAPAVKERQQRLAELVAGGFESLARAVSRQKVPGHVDISLSDDLRSCSALGARLLPGLIDASSRLFSLQPAIRDIWHDHVLFEGDRVSGIVDYGALRLDTHLTDLARLIGSLVEDDSRLREMAMDAYSSILPLSPAECQLIDLLDRSSVVISLANWAQWLYVEGRQFEDRPRVNARILKLAQRLRTLRRVVGS